MRAFLKKLNAWLHLWLGLASGVVVFIVSITGCILVFETEIKSIAFPWINVEKPADGKYLPPSALHRAAAARLPDSDLHSLWYHGEDKTAHFTAGDSMVFIDPYTAELKAIIDHEDFFDFMLDGHVSLWLPREVGHQVVGWSTLVFFLLLVTGIILWWPRRWNKRYIRQAFSIKWKARAKRVNYDLHNVLGFYSLIIAAVMALTGLIMVFPWFSKSVYWLSGGEAKQYVQPVSDTGNITQVSMFERVDSAWTKGLTAIGQYNRDAIIVHFPETPSEAIYLCVDMYQGSWRDVYLDQYTLEELPASQVRISEADRATWLRRMNYGLHVGEVGGVGTKSLYFLASLICASLPITGFFVWMGRGKKKKRAALVYPSTQNRKSISQS